MAGEQVAFTDDRLVGIFKEYQSPSDKSKKPSVVVEGDSIKVSAPVLQEIVTKYANDRHGKLEADRAEKEKWLGLGVMTAEELGATKTRLATLEKQYGDAISKADGGADLVKIRKEIDDARKDLAQQTTHFNLSKVTFDTAMKEREANCKRVENFLSAVKVAQEEKISLKALVESGATTEDEQRRFARIVRQQVEESGGKTKSMKLDTHETAGSADDMGRLKTGREKLRAGVEKMEAEAKT